jgi:hypothetical protein
MLLVLTRDGTGNISCIYTLEQTEEATRNGQSRDNGNMGHKTQDEVKQNKTIQHNTEN